MHFFCANDELAALAHRISDSPIHENKRNIPVSRQPLDRARISLPHNNNFTPRHNDPIGFYPDRMSNRNNQYLDDITDLGCEDVSLTLTTEVGLDLQDPTATIGSNLVPDDKTNYAGLTPSPSCQDLIFRRTGRNQFKKLSEVVKARTELHSIDPATPDPPGTLSKEEELSGLAYWFREASLAKEHGGDYATRHESALRAALGGFVTFSVLVFPKQQIIGCVWIGAIFFHANLKDSFGAAYESSKGYAFSILVTTLSSLPVATFLKGLGTGNAQITFPFVTFLLSFIIMSCPQLTGHNLMILVMYLIISSQVRPGVAWWEPLGWLVSYWIGLVFAVLANIIPKPRLAIDSTHILLHRLENDMVMLLEEGKQFATHAANRPGIARSATACIEMLQCRINESVKALKTELRSTGIELGLRCRTDASADLKEWITQAEKLLGHVKSLRSALVGHVLGEEIAMNSSVLVLVKANIEEQIAPARDRLVDAMIAGLAVCTAWADPCCQRTVFPDVKDELYDAINECRGSFTCAIEAIDKVMEQNPETNVAIFAHLTRRMSAFDALFEFGKSLHMFLSNRDWVKQEIRGKQKGNLAIVQHAAGAARDFVSTKWLWHKPDSLRLALKTSVGMAVASLFVSVTYLFNISQPFEHWPGLTIASVNLGSTASSFHKASDRLYGTLLAASYCLLVADLFPGNKDYVKIPAIAIFTYVVLYLKDAEHEYKYVYAATSIGSMFYGSIKNDFNVFEYIPKRIELIFIGVMIFGVVELFLFPRSSRKMVENLSFRFFLDARDFLKQAAICSQQMERYLRFHALSPNSSLLVGTDNLEDLFHLDKLETLYNKMKTSLTKLKQELESGISEPNVGLSLVLDPESFRGLVKEQGDVEIQALMLLNGLRIMGSCYLEEGNTIRNFNWPLMHSRMVADAANTMDWSCEWLKTVYPDGRLRPQKNTSSVKAVTAAAAFRGLEDVRLRAMVMWSEKYDEFVRKGRGLQHADPVAIMTIGTTTNYFLELCRHLQKAGRHVEEIAHRFPAGKNH